MIKNMRRPKNFSAWIGSLALIIAATITSLANAGGLMEGANKGQPVVVF